MAMASTSFDLCPPSSPDFVKPAFPVYFDKADGNATYFASFCWPAEALRQLQHGWSPSYWLASQILSAASSSSLLAVGLLTLLSSDFSDEIVDLASAMTTVNGLRRHSFPFITFRGVLEEVDQLSMLIAALLFFKGMLRALFPVINSSQYLRTVINLLIVCVMFTAACWTSFNLPPELYNSSRYTRRWSYDIVTPLLWFGIAGITYGVHLTDARFLELVRSNMAQRVRSSSAGQRSAGLRVGEERSDPRSLSLRGSSSSAASSPVRACVNHAFQVGQKEVGGERTQPGSGSSSMSHSSVSSGGSGRRGGERRRPRQQPA